MTDWQDISTAPKDGSAVWVASPYTLCVAYWSRGCWRNWFKGPRYENVHISADAFLPDPVWFVPNYWQPLPTPPKESA